MRTTGNFDLYAKMALTDGYTDVVCSGKTYDLEEVIDVVGLNLNDGVKKIGYKEMYDKYGKCEIYKIDSRITDFITSKALKQVEAIQLGKKLLVDKDLVKEYAFGFEIRRGVVSGVEKYIINKDGEYIESWALLEIAKGRAKDLINEVKEAPITAEDHAWLVRYKKEVGDVDNALKLKIDNFSSSTKNYTVSLEEVDKVIDFSNKEDVFTNKVVVVPTINGMDDGFAKAFTLRFNVLGLKRLVVIDYSKGAAFDIKEYDDSEGLPDIYDKRRYIYDSLDGFINDADFIIGIPPAEMVRGLMELVRDKKMMLLINNDIYSKNYEDAGSVYDTYDLGSFGKKPFYTYATGAGDGSSRIGDDFGVYTEGGARRKVHHKWFTNVKLLKDWGKDVPYALGDCEYSTRCNRLKKLERDIYVGSDKANKIIEYAKDLEDELITEEFDHGFEIVDDGKDAVVYKDGLLLGVFDRYDYAVDYVYYEVDKIDGVITLRVLAD